MVRKAQLVHSRLGAGVFSLLVTMTSLRHDLSLDCRVMLRSGTQDLGLRFLLGFLDLAVLRVERDELGAVLRTEGREHPPWFLFGERLEKLASRKLTRGH